MRNYQSRNWGPNYQVQTSNELHSNDSTLNDTSMTGSVLYMWMCSHGMYCTCGCVSMACTVHVNV